MKRLLLPVVAGVALAFSSLTFAASAEDKAYVAKIEKEVLDACLADGTLPKEVCTCSAKSITKTLTIEELRAFESATISQEEAEAIGNKMMAAMISCITPE